MFNKLNEMMLRRKNMLHISENDFIGIENMSKNDKETVIQYVVALQNNINNLGYSLSKELFEKLCECKPEAIERIYVDTIESLKSIKGADVQYNPLWPDFPDVVNSKSEIELYFMAIVHYLSDGELYPNVDETTSLYPGTKLPSLDYSVAKELRYGTDKDVDTLLKTLMSQSVAYSAQDVEDVTYLMSNIDWKNSVPDKMINKENMIKLTMIAKELNEDINVFLNNYKTSTDILRYAVALSGGDSSLKDAEKVKFKNASRKDIRFMMQALNKCKDLDETLRKDPALWNKVTYRWHIGDYDMSDATVKRKTDIATAHGKEYTPLISKKEYEKKYKNVVTSFAKMRNKDFEKSFMGKVEELIEKGKGIDAARMLASRPGEFGRRLETLIRNSNDIEKVLDMYESVATKIAPTVLISMLGHFEKATEDKICNVYFPKGNTAKSYVTPATKGKLNEDVVNRVVSITKKALSEIYAEKGELGKVYIAEDTKGYKAPMVLRNASKNGEMIPRGSRLPIDGDGKNNIARFFIWWTNEEHGGRVDIDLSGAVFDKDWRLTDRVSYYNLRGDYGYHSGDITNGGPSNGNGAAEFVDMDLEKYKESGAKYVVFTIHNYTGQTFDRTPCKFGWMERNEINGREAFEPKSVKNAGVLTSNSTQAVPIIVDVESREVIWADMSSGYLDAARNLDNTLDSTVATCYAIANNEFVDLKDLIEINAMARGELTNDPTEANLIICKNSALLGEDLLEKVKIVSVSDLSAINALFINPEISADKNLLPDLTEDEIEETIEEVPTEKPLDPHRNDGLRRIISLIQSGSVREDIGLEK